MSVNISEVEVTFVRQNNGLIAFASFVIDNAVYCGSVAVMTRPTGDYRLVYPTKTVGNQQINVFNPINREAGRLIEEVVINKIEDVMRLNNDNRHSGDYATSESV